MLVHNPLVMNCIWSRDVVASQVPVELRPVKKIKNYYFQILNLLNIFCNPSQCIFLQSPLRAQVLDQENINLISILFFQTSTRRYRRQNSVEHILDRAIVVSNIMTALAYAHDHFTASHPTKNSLYPFPQLPTIFLSLLFFSYIPSESSVSNSASSSNSCIGGERKS